MNSLIETLNQWGDGCSGFAWPMLWQSSLLIAALLAFDFLFRRQLRAAIRYALWLVVLVKLCVPPTFALPTSPAWWWHKTPPPVVAKPATRAYTVTYDQGPLPELSPVPLMDFTPPPPTMTKAAWLLAISASASTLLLLWMLARWGQITCLVRHSAPSDRLTALADAARRGLGMKRRVPVKLTAQAMSPAVCGLFCPTILIPQSLADTFSDEQLSAVLLHELIHLRRADVWVNFFQTLLQIAYWWHPLVWLANARLRRVREDAVDDAVMLALRDEAETYAPTLLEVAKLALNRPLATLGLVGILESRSALRQRIERLVDFHPPRQAGLTLGALLGILAFTAVAVPMGQGPEPVAVVDDSPPSFTLMVNPAIFIRNVRAQAAATLHATNDPCPDILMDILQGEGVDCAPPHGLVFNPQTGELTAYNTPETLGIVRRVIEQLNRADGRCVLPLRDSKLHRQQVLITAQFYTMPTADFTKLVEGLDAVNLDVGKSFVGVLQPEHGAEFNQKLKVLGLKPFSRPRLVTNHGSSAALSVGNGTNGVEFECLPLIHEPEIELRFHAQVTGDPVGADGALAGSAVYQLSGKTKTKNQGGMIVCANNPDVSAKIKLVVVINLQLVSDESGLRPAPDSKSAKVVATNAAFALATTSSVKTDIMTDPNFRVALKALEQRNGVENLGEPEATTSSGHSRNRITTTNISAPFTNSVAVPLSQKPMTNFANEPKIAYTGEGRQSISRKLNTIRLERAAFDKVPLGEVLRYLSAESRKLDPDHHGINFLINSNPELPAATNAPAAVELVSLPITMNPRTNVLVADVLDALVLGTPRPIRYSVQDFAVVFSDGQPPPPPVKLVVAEFKVNARRFLEATGNSLFQATPDFVAEMARKYFRSQGVNWELPVGKVISFNEKTEVLKVYVTRADSEIIEQALLVLDSRPPPQTVATNAVVAPVTQADATNITGLMTDTNFRVAFRALEQRNGVEALAEPEVPKTISSGRGINKITLPSISAPFANSVVAQTNAATAPEPAGQITATFRLNYPKSEAELKKLLQTAGVKTPPTVFFYTDNGMLLVRGSKAQLALVNCEMMKLNGVPAAEAEAASKNYTPFGSATMADQAGTNLFTRTFKVDTRLFIHGLKQIKGAGEGINEANNLGQAISMAARKFFSLLGVNLESPAGKAVFYNDRNGVLLVKATLADLDTVDRAIQALNQTAPQIHTKARFFEVPKGTFQALVRPNLLTNALINTLKSETNWSGLMSDEKFRTVLRMLASKPGAESLGEPEATTASGRQTQIRATTVITVVTNLIHQNTGTNEGVVPQIANIETGPILNIVPYVLADGDTINLWSAASVTDFLGGAKTTKTTLAHTSTGETINVPAVSPQFRVRQATSLLNLWDGQTVVLGTVDDNSALVERLTFEGWLDTGKSKPQPKELLVFITVNIVDPAGNRIHADDELPFARNGVPTQPPPVQK